MRFISYIRLWLACVRYSVVRTMMFRFDFLMWSLVEFFWMGINIAVVLVIYGHTDSVAGWSKYEMMLLVGTSMLLQRLMMGLFWSNIFELGRNIRLGNFDFILAQPGNVLFMVSTRKLDLDSLANVLIAAVIIIYAALQLHIALTFGHVLAYLVLLVCGLAINYSIILIAISLTFWIINSEGVEGSYFALSDFSRIPRAAFNRLALEVVFVYAMPVVIVSNIPASTLLRGPELVPMLWLVLVATAWFSLAVFIFNRGLRRYASASS